MTLNLIGKTVKSQSVVPFLLAFWSFLYAVTMTLVQSIHHFMTGRAIDGRLIA